MAVNITARRMQGGMRHEHIVRVRWIDPASQKTGENSRQEMVEWIRDKSGKAFVVSGSNRVAVGVVNGRPPYLRTHADGVWTDNLLALPTF